MNSEIAEKTERLCKMLVAQSLGGVLINAQHNFAWLTGGKSNGINLSVENGACFLFVRRDSRKFVLANNIEMPRLLSEEISAHEFEPVEFSWQDEKSAGDFVVKKAQSFLNDNENLASDLFLNDKVRPVENLIARCRYELTAPEIERYRKLGKDAGAAIGKLFENIEPGETEIEIARKTRDVFAADNINSVVTLVGADERIGKFRHPVPTANRWKKVLLIGICAKREGLIVNLSRLVCAGEIPDELRRRTDAAAFVFAKLLSETKPGKTSAELYRIAADAYAEKGFAAEINLHHQGGATGYKTRDWVIHPNSNETVFPRQAFAWNPSITGTKAEENCFVSGGGEIEMLTETPGFPRIGIEIGGRGYFSPDILSL